MTGIPANATATSGCALEQRVLLAEGDRLVRADQMPAPGVDDLDSAQIARSRDPEEILAHPVEPTERITAVGVERLAPPRFWAIVSSHRQKPFVELPFDLHADLR